MEVRTHYRGRRRHALAAFALVGIAACHASATTVTGPAKGSFAVSRGSDFTLVLQTVGPGEYASPPAVSSGSVHFLGVSQAAATVPAGPTQEFRFHAASVGQAVIVFQHTGSNPPIADPILVR